MKVAALIPARSGSKGIPLKNFKMFCGKPLVSWTTMAAIESGVFDKIILSMDGGWDLVDWKSADPRMLKKYNGVLEIDNNRPKEMSNDEAGLDVLLCYYSRRHEEIDLWCLLQPTSPLRLAEDIRQARAMMDIKGGPYGKDGDIKYESLVSVSPNPVMAWIKDAVGIPGDPDTPQPIATYHYQDRPNRQERSDWFLENGAIYFTRKYILDYFKVRLHGSIAMYEMPYERSFEIDEPIDWFICEKMIERRQNGVG